MEPRRKQQRFGIQGCGPGQLPKGNGGKCSSGQRHPEIRTVFNTNRKDLDFRLNPGAIFIL